MKKIISFISTIFLSVCMSSCSFYKIEKGMSYMGLVPSLNLGIQTNQTEYEINNVNLDIYYGWSESYFVEANGYSYEAVVIFVHDAIVSAHEMYDLDFNDYYELENIEKEVYNISTNSSYKAKCHILKVINEDLNNDKYIVKLSRLNKALYKTHETFNIPSEVLVNPKVGFNITIASVWKNKETGKYNYLYSSDIHFSFNILENGNINLH